MTDNPFVPDSPADLARQPGPGIREGSAQQRAEQPWSVVVIFDPAGVEPNFAYTTGLHVAFGHPELIMSARPRPADAQTAEGLEDDRADGQSPWELSRRDIHMLLNQIGDQIRESGPLTMGQSWDEAVDGDGSALVFTIVDADDIPGGPQATGLLADDVPVWGVDVALRRPPVGQFTAPDAPARDSLAQRSRQWLLDLARHDRVPYPDGPVDVSDDQEFGPATAAVRAVLTLAQGADDEQAWDAAMLQAASPQLSGLDLSYLRALARQHGRHKWAAAIERQMAAACRDAGKRLDVDGDAAHLLGPALAQVHTPTALAWLLADVISADDLAEKTALTRVASLRKTAASPGSGMWLVGASAHTPAVAWPDVERASAAYTETEGLFAGASDKQMSRLVRALEVDMGELTHRAAMAQVASARAGRPALWTLPLSDAVEERLDVLGEDDASMAAAGFVGVVSSFTADGLVHRSVVDGLRNPFRIAKLVPAGW